MNLDKLKQLAEEARMVEEAIIGEKDLERAYTEALTEDALEHAKYMAERAA